MHGLTQLQHNIVGNVNYVANGTHAASTQAALHPLGGLGDFNILQHAGSEARAQLRRFNFNAHIIAGLTCGGFLHVHSGHFQRTAGDGADFSSQADNAEAVSAITGQIDIDDGVVKAQNLFYVHANGSIRRQNKDAITLLRQQHLIIDA